VQNFHSILLAAHWWSVYRISSKFRFSNLEFSNHSSIWAVCRTFVTVSRVCGSSTMFAVFSDRNKEFHLFNLLLFLFHRVLACFKLNPFEHLNLSFDSSPEDVKRQYRKVFHFRLKVLDLFFLNSNGWFFVS
jgi:hypothetical protein